MATLQINTGIVEYLKIKCFAYSYRPPFTPIEKKTATLEVIEGVTFPLAEQYFNKYDISNYVVGYTFEQNLYENTFGWSIILEDHIFTDSDFVQFLSTNFQNQDPIKNTAALNNLANYEVMTPTPYERQARIDPSTFVKQAILGRGNAETEYVDKLGGGQKVQGIRLSDLLQKYDMISLFLYKENSPLEELKGTKDFVEVQNDLGTTLLLPIFIPSSAGVGLPLSVQDLQYETVLLSAHPNFSETIFSNEFNGFIITKTFTRNISGVDEVTISGNGITRLLGSTRRIIKPSVLQDSIYNEFSAINTPDISANQTIFAGSPIEQIIRDLFSLVYNIGFETGVNGNISNSFYDISSMQIKNERDAVLFTIPPYLLAIAMKYRLFSFRQIIVSELNKIGISSDVTPEGLSLALDKLPSDVQIPLEVPNILSPVIFDKKLIGLTTYFSYLDKVYEIFNPRLSTPFEILDDVKKVTMAEIFELPNGTITIRNPQYNNVNNVHFSGNFNILNVSYNETVSDLLSKMKIAYGISYLPGGISVAQEYAFVDGKFMKQFGPLESSTDANPNASDVASTDNTNNQNKDPILSHYAEFFLRYHDAMLNTGSIIMDLANRVVVGDTFFDEKNSKFGYIIGISKTMTPGQPATMILTLSFVRDAFNADPTTKKGSNLEFSILPTLQYVNGSPDADTPEISSEATG